MIRAIAATLFNTALFAALILGPPRALTGSWDWPRGWLAVALFAAESVVGAAFFWLTDPALVRERTSVSPQSGAAASGVARSGARRPSPRPRDRRLGGARELVRRHRGQGAERPARDRGRSLRMGASPDVPRRAPLARGPRARA